MKRLLMIPVLALGYYIFGVFFDMPFVEHVLGLLLALQIVVIVAMHVFGAKYDGYVEVELDQGGVKKVSFVVEGDPETLLESKDELRFKVNKEESQ